jgi:hypothetical protein
MAYKCPKQKEAITPGFLPSLYRKLADLELWSVASEYLSIIPEQSIALSFARAYSLAAASGNHKDNAERNESRRLFLNHATQCI